MKPFSTAAVGGASLCLRDTGPASFRTKDAEWSDDYQLIGAGLLAAPLEA
jgi:hypothetical protein